MRYVKSMYCLHCKNLFIPKEFRKSRPTYFCNNTCSVKYRSGEKHPLYKGGSFNGDGYRIIRRPGPNGNSHAFLEHRYLMEQHLGRPLAPDEHIHHIDGNRINNCLSNLKIMTHSDHSKLHHSNYFRNDTHKECIKCHEIKPRIEFSPINKKDKEKSINADHNKSYCKKCMCKITTKYHKINK